MESVGGKGSHDIQRGTQDHTVLSGEEERNPMRAIGFPACTGAEQFEQRKIEIWLHHQPFAYLAQN